MRNQSILCTFQKQRKRRILPTIKCPLIFISDGWIRVSFQRNYLFAIEHTPVGVNVTSTHTYTQDEKMKRGY